MLRPNRKKTRLLTAVLCVAALILAAPVPLPVQAGISVVTRPDISGGILTGAMARYTLAIPEVWRKNIFVERDTSQTSPLEQLCFYFQPSDKITKPTRFLCLSVYNKSDENFDPAQPKVLETTNYNFMAELYTNLAFPVKQDNNTYHALLAFFGNDLQLESLIQLPKTDRKILHNTVTVNGKLLMTHLIPESNHLYIPLRDAAQALGYTLRWDSVNEDVILIKGTSSYTLMTRPGVADPDYAPVNHDGTVYVLPDFFIEVIHTTWDMDDKNNVYIRQF